MNCGSTSDWNALLAIQAGAAATLTGLVFVAVSVNAQKIMEYPGLPGRAAEAILQLVDVFFICTVALVPNQSAKGIAIEFLSIGLLFWTSQVVVQIRYFRVRAGHPWWWFALRAVLGQLASVPFCIAGITLLFGNCAAFYWLVPGFIFSFAAAMISAWVLLVEILR